MTAGHRKHSGIQGRVLASTGLRRTSEADLALGDRVDADVHGYAIRPARQLLYVPARSLRHRAMVSRRNRFRSTRILRNGQKAHLTWEPVSGFEPLACRLQDGLSPHSTVETSRGWSRRITFCLARAALRVDLGRCQSRLFSRHLRPNCVRSTSLVDLQPGAATTCPPGRGPHGLLGWAPVGWSRCRHAAASVAG